MRYLKNYTYLIATVLLAIVSCAKETEESQREIQERILDAYIAVHYPNAQKRESGLTILELKQGTGAFPKELGGCYIHYDTYNLDGVCQSTTDSVKAKELGTYSPSTYYGPQLFSINDYYTTIGMMELLQLLNKGSEVTAIIPPWLTTSNPKYSRVQGSQQTVSANIIYKIKMGAIFDDVIKFQTDSLEAYSNRYFTPAIDSTDNGFYFRNLTHTTGIPDKDTVESGTKVNIWYIGRLLDGYVFDTNIADTAKKYGIYSSSSSYSPLSTEILETADLMKGSGNDKDADGTNSGLILGMCKALKKMTIGDNAVTFFSSGYGYGNEGTMSGGKGVPEYAMLRFDIWMTDNDDKNYPPKGYR